MTPRGFPSEVKNTELKGDDFRQCSAVQFSHLIIATRSDTAVLDIDRGFQKVTVTSIQKYITTQEFYNGLQSWN